jgi:hypothetical protein
MNLPNVPKGNRAQLMEEEEVFVKSGMTAIELELSNCRQGLAHHMACLMIQPSDYEWLLRDAFHGRPLVTGALDAASGKPKAVRFDACKKLFVEDDGRLIVPMDMMARWYLEASQSQQREGGEQRLESLGPMTNIGAEWLRQVAAGNPNPSNLLQVDKNGKYVGANIDGKLVPHEELSHLHRDRHCQVCRIATVKLCSQCSITYYCSVGCQQADWRTHEQTCGKLELDSHGKLVPRPWHFILRKDRAFCATSLVARLSKRWLVMVVVVLRKCLDKMLDMQIENEKRWKKSAWTKSDERDRRKRMLALEPSDFNFSKDIWSLIVQCIPTLQLAKFRAVSTVFRRLVTAEMRKRCVKLDDPVSIAEMLDFAYQGCVVSHVTYQGREYYPCDTFWCERPVGLPEQRDYDPNRKCDSVDFFRHPMNPQDEGRLFVDQEAGMSCQELFARLQRFPKPNYVPLSSIHHLSSSLHTMTW